MFPDIDKFQHSFIETRILEHSLEDRLVSLGGSSREHDSIELVLIHRSLDILCSARGAIAQIVIGTHDTLDAFRFLDQLLAIDDRSYIDASSTDENAYLGYLVFFFIF